jgi:hypothetical protein
MEMTPGGGGTLLPLVTPTPTVPRLHIASVFLPLATVPGQLPWFSQVPP